jgi:hypothetical protein
VTTHGGLDQARNAAQRVGLAAPVLLPTGDLLRSFHVDAVPWTVIIGRDGRAREALRGGQSRKTFEAAIAAAL